MVLRRNPRSVVAHELGHGLQLRHRGVAPSKLMCGPTPDQWTVTQWFTAKLVCSSEFGGKLDPWEVNDATRYFLELAAPGTQ